jgi:hypothetical protein
MGKLGGCKGMNSRNSKKALLWMLVIIMLLFWNQDISVASAATPAFKNKSLTFNGTGKNYKLKIKNWVSGSKYKWYSSNKKIAKVSSKGVITSVGKGKTYVKCKITYPKGRKKTLSCKVTVKIPANGIKITNKVENNGIHVMTVGESHTFGSSILPSDTSYKAYWFSGKGGDPSCIEIGNASTGLVNAKKPGIAILVAAAVKVSTKKAAALSNVKDSIIIEVVEAPASVKSVQILNSTDIKVEFDCQINKSSVIGTDNKLLDSIKISLGKNAKGIIAENPGKLTATLSDDLKTLTITAANRFSGNYVIEFTNQIMTVGNTALKGYLKQISYTDNIPPSISSVILDDSGVINVITFSEAMDFTKLKVSDAELVRNSKATECEASTITILNNELNYSISENKKSLSINLSKISSADYNKKFCVTISGVKDLSGNYPRKYTLTLQLYTDTTPKPQSVPYNVTRTAYNTITAYFTRSIQSAGTAAVNNGALVYGQVDKNNNKMVNYVLSKEEQSLSGNIDVYLSNWDSYNVISSDTSSYKGRKFSVNFTPDKTNPLLLSYEYDSKINVLSLTYSEKVDLNKNTNIFSATLITASDDIRPGTNITYTKTDSADDKVISLKLPNVTVIGKYIITLDKGFVLDAFANGSDKKAITINNNFTENSDELPPPYSVSQSPKNTSQICVEFSNKLDVASAQNISNYVIPGVVITSAQVTKNTTDNGAEVLLTVADGSIAASVERPITIAGVKGYKASRSAMSAYTVTIILKENKRAYFIAPLIFDRTTGNNIIMNFSEEIEGSLTLKVMQIKGSSRREIGNTVRISGNKVYINLYEIPDRNNYLRISVVKNLLSDKSKNAVNLPTTLGITAVY